MLIKIERHPTAQTTTLRVMGPLGAGDLVELRQQMEGAGGQLIMDLGDVTLVDATTVLFLADCESEGVSLRRCSRYIREWIRREQGTSA